MSNLSLIADNETLFDELKALIEKQFALDTLDTSSSNEQLGEHVRARLEGFRLVQGAFREIENHATSPAKSDDRNPAR